LTKTDIKNRQSSQSKQGHWKGVPPNSSQGHGQWKQKSNTKYGEKIGFQMVSVKVRPAEAIEFKKTCDGLGITRNHALRSMIRRVTGFMEIDKSALQELQSITRQLNGVATNINQIAKAGNRTQSPDYHAFMEDRRELGIELGRLQGHLQTILDLARRRTDGLGALKIAAGLE